jgi:hypothetical protein
MGLRHWPLPFVILLAGCLNDRQTAPLVGADTFGSAPPTLPIAKVNHAPAEEATAQRVADMGKRLVEANPNLGFRPMFRTVGSPEVEIFHRGTAELVVTEGLVDKCATEGQLAAVLAMELGRMVSEREALAGAHVRRIERDPPMDLRVGSDIAGASGPADRTRLAELAPYERDRKRRDDPPPPPPDPRALARLYLLKANVPASELDAADPILRAAGQNGALEKQLTIPPAGQP